MVGDSSEHHQFMASIIRRSDIPGTPEYEQAQKDKDKASPWNGKCLLRLAKYIFDHDIDYVKTKEAIETTVGAKNPVGSKLGQAHRPGLDARMADERRQHGQEGYHPQHPGGKARGNDPKHGKLAHSQPSLPPGSLDPAKDPVTTQTYGRRGVVPAKRRLPSLVAPAKAPLPPPGAPTGPARLTKHPKNLVTAKGLLPAPASRARPARPTKYSENLMSAPQFMAALRCLQEAAAEAPGNSTSRTNAEDSQVDVNAPDIRKIKLEELSFPAQCHSDPNDVSTHTDGAPSPVSTTELADLIDMDDDSIDGLDELTEGFKGLGISDQDRSMKALSGPVSAPATTPYCATSICESIMDSPNPTPLCKSIMDSPVPTQALCKIHELDDQVLVHNGRRYIREDKVLQLKAQLLQLANNGANRPDQSPDRSVSDYGKVVIESQDAHSSSSNAPISQKAVSDVFDASANFETSLGSSKPPAMKPSSSSAVLAQSPLASLPTSTTGSHSKKPVKGLMESRWAPKNFSPAAPEQSAQANLPTTMTGILTEKSVNGLTQWRWAAKTFPPAAPEQSPLATLSTSTRGPSQKPVKGLMDSRWAPKNLKTQAGLDEDRR